MTASEQVPILDPEIEVMTFEQLAQLVNEVDPRTFYERAQAFDTALARLEQVQDNLARGTRELWDSWRGEGAESFADVVRNVAGAANTAIQAMAAPGYGATLRRAGDALTLAQQRIRDLQAQKRESDLPAARLVVHELGVAYQEIGSAITPFPGAETDIPVNGQGPLMNTAPPSGAVPGNGMVQPSSGDQMGQHGYGPGSHGGGVMPVAAMMGPSAPGQHGRRDDFWAALLGDPARDRTESVTPAVLGRETPVVAGRPEVREEATTDGPQNGPFLAVLGRGPAEREPEKKQKHKRVSETEKATT
ncbi:WXG100 family type VII secretion target, partial [Amycolatopsis japonica]|uniref:WXG100 family type VII secretion target n=1 Tax=Amycolatopsis japonica TaxID=208439 RepID=UPI00366F7B8B